MSGVLKRWNLLPAEAAADEILPCCGSRGWASGVTARRPLADEETLLAVSDRIWNSLAEADWREAFRSHPRIGETQAPNASHRSAAWSGEEQRKVADATASAKLALVEGNREYESRFGRIFIVCATGKSPEEILTILRRRLENDHGTELRETAEQQRQITQFRLRKWLQV
jgi:2-oxo-4-hydroxy-4-carboxy-5-ureidoimidazoline decarboxylase